MISEKDYKKIYDEMYESIDEKDVSLFHSLDKPKEIDVNNMTADTIQINLKNNINTDLKIRVGNFIIYLHSYNRKLIIFEEKKNKHFTSQHKLDVKNDKRFSSKSWKDKFNLFKIGNCFTIAEVVDVCRWLQAIQKYNYLL